MAPSQHRLDLQEVLLLATGCYATIRLSGPNDAWDLIWKMLVSLSMTRRILQAGRREEASSRNFGTDMLLHLLFLAVFALAPAIALSTSWGFVAAMQCCSYAIGQYAVIAACLFRWLIRTSWQSLSSFEKCCLCYRSVDSSWILCYTNGYMWIRNRMWPGFWDTFFVMSCRLWEGKQASASTSYKFSPFIRLGVFSPDR